MKGLSMLKWFFFLVFFLTKFAEGFAKNKAAMQKTLPVWLLFYTVKLIKKNRQHLLWEQQQRSWMLEKLPWSMVHLWRVSINMAVVHERPFIAWCACQMAYKSRSSLVLLSRTLQAILLWQYGDWPLSWAACGEPQRARLAEAPC